MTEPYRRFIGGEAGHRSFFGGQHSPGRIALIIFFAVLGAVVTILAGAIGLVLALVGVGITMLVTTRTHRGTIAGRVRNRRRWRQRVAAGTDAFVPYDPAEWDRLTAAAAAARGRNARWLAQRELASMRAMPDGADGMGWLQYGRGEPGIAWHAPVGEQSYLSVAFAVEGQLRGIESPALMARSAESWGKLLAARAAPSSLLRDVQTVTRVVPADTALQEFWVLAALDPTAPEDAVRSYEQVLQRTGAGAMVQRHYVTLQWPLTNDFYAAAARYAAGRDGWRALMRDEIAAAHRALVDARMGSVTVLSARQLTAVLLHSQNPSRPVDLVADVRPEAVGVRSHDEFSAHIVEGLDPIDGTPGEWWHRTARIEGANASTGGRSQLWTLELLIGTQLAGIRSVSFHLHLVPAVEAKTATRQDLVRDGAEAMAKKERGQLELDGTQTHLTAAQRRAADLREGSGHHGASWVGYVTISHRSRDELARASRQLEDVCAGSLGIQPIVWLDSYQSAASGTTWPIGRGARGDRVHFSSRVYRGLAGTGNKEAIS